MLSLHCLRDIDPLHHCRTPCIAYITLSSCPIYYARLPFCRCLSRLRKRTNISCSRRLSRWENGVCLRYGRSFMAGQHCLASNLISKTESSKSLKHPKSSAGNSLICRGAPPWISNWISTKSEIMSNNSISNQRQKSNATESRYGCWTECPQSWNFSTRLTFQCRCLIDIRRYLFCGRLPISSCHIISSSQALSFRQCWSGKSGRNTLKRGIGYGVSWYNGGWLDASNDLSRLVCLFVLISRQSFDRRALGQRTEIYVLVTSKLVVSVCVRG